MEEKSSGIEPGFFCLVPGASCAGKFVKLVRTIEYMIMKTDM